MPRSGVNGTYTLPGAQKTQQPLTPIPSAVNNQGWEDVEQTFNTPTPIAYGGTGQAELVLPSDEFGIKDGSNGTKRVVFNLSGITASTTRTLTVPDASGTIPLLGVSQTWNGAQSFSSATTFGGNVLQSTGYYRNQNGGSAAQPSIQPGNDGDTGMYWVATNRIGFTTAGVKALEINASGQVLSIAGSAAAPAYSFDGDPNTGIYNSSADVIGFSAGGTEAGRMSGTTFLWGASSFNSAAAVQTRVVGSSGRIDILNASGSGATILASYYTDSSTLVGSITNNSTTTAFNTSSDERLKTNFADFDSGPIIDAINIYHYDWVQGGTGYGPKAQELHEVFPDAVTAGSVGDKPGDETFIPWGYDASKLVPILIREVQNLRKRIADLEAK